MLRPSALKILIPGLLLPGAALALGLGDIRVESALHQPLAAQIEIVGANAENSAGLSASIADQETFQRYGLERPLSLASTALTVRKDEQGHTFLLLRSTDAFTEPMVIFLVDLHSPSGELIREYTVLLDPPGMAADHGVAESAAAQPVAEGVSPPESALSTNVKAPSIATERHPSDESAKPTPDTYTVARRDTLARIASIAGAHSRADRRKMMVAIFRANPSAFQTNLNNLRTGVTLHLPSVADLSKLSADDANREFASQMAAWRSPDHHASFAASTSAGTTSPASTSANASSTPSARSEPRSVTAPVAAGALAANPVAMTTASLG